jgi:hypothetical protein
VTQAWPILEPATPFVDGIHIAAMCLHLQAVTNGQIQNLIINVLPGHAKSLITAVFWPAWVWINHPEVRMLYSSNRVDLAIRDSLKCRRLIESPWYQQVPGPDPDPPEQLARGIPRRLNIMFVGPYPRTEEGLET